jgi:hypothetical protein
MELGISAQDVVKETDMGIPQVLHGLDKVAQPHKVSPKLGERDGDANMHTDLLMASEQHSVSERLLEQGCKSMVL